MILGEAQSQEKGESLNCSVHSTHDQSHYSPLPGGLPFTHPGSSDEETNVGVESATRGATTGNRQPQTALPPKLG